MLRPSLSVDQPAVPALPGQLGGSEDPGNQRDRRLALLEREHRRRLDRDRAALAGSRTYERPHNIEEPSGHQCDTNHRHTDWRHTYNQL